MLHVTLSALASCYVYIHYYIQDFDVFHIFPYHPLDQNDYPSPYSPLRVFSAASCIWQQIVSRSSLNALSEKLKNIEYRMYLRECIWQNVLSEKLKKYRIQNVFDRMYLTYSLKSWKNTEYRMYLTPHAEIIDAESHLGWFKL